MVDEKKMLAIDAVAEKKIAIKTKEVTFEDSASELESEVESEDLYVRKKR